MADTITKPKIKDEIKVERPRLYKVVLLNDDFTPRGFVVTVVKAEFRMSGDQARRVRRCRLHEGCRGGQGNQGNGCGPKQGYPLLFSTEPEK